MISWLELLLAEEDGLRNQAGDSIKFKERVNAFFEFGPKFTPVFEELDEESDLTMNSE